MINHFHPTLKHASTLSEVLTALIISFEDAKKRKKINQIGYVSGMITSEGVEHIPKNILILKNHSLLLRQELLYPVFSAPDVFTDEMFIQIDADNIPYDHWIYFWRDVLKSGHITDVFMAPRWEKSKGATDEFETATELGLTIHYI